MLAFILSLALGQDLCPDASEFLDASVQQLILLDETQLRSDLDQVDVSFHCAWAEPDEVARWWLLRGASRQLAGDDDGMRSAFAMAHSISPEIWVDVLGEQLRAAYDQERVIERPRSRLVVSGVGAASVRVDGTPLDEVKGLLPGMHVLQIGVGDEVQERRDVVIVAGQGAVVDFGRGDVEPEGPPPDPVDRPSSAPVGVGLHLVATAGFAYTGGEEVVANQQVEPATKLSVPLELGLVGSFGPAWVRAQVGYAPLLNGQLLYLSGDEVRGTGGFLMGGGGVGVHFAGLDVGALGQAVIPSRVGVRGLVGYDLVGPLGVEARGGVNLHPERAAEPAIEVLVRFKPELL